MSKFLSTLVLLLCAATPSVAQASGGQTLSARRIRNPRVSYTPGAKFRSYPIPPVVFERGGLAKKGEREEIIEKVVYPLINETERAIAAFVVEFYPDKPYIGVTIIWQTSAARFMGSYWAALVNKNKEGHFDKDAYRVFFEEP